MLFPRGGNMPEMRVMEFVETNGDLSLRPATRAVPEPAPGELLIQIRAAGVTPSEKLWYPTTRRQDGSPRSHAIPGHEFSGIVAAVGRGASSFNPGDAVFGMNDWFGDGATAEFCVAKPAHLVRKPASLSHLEAAATPIGALTAWQGLYDRGQLRPGARVLIHGAAGAVGLFSVQLAKHKNAHVVATASAAHAGMLRELGADEVIDYRAQAFEQVASKCDVIFDTVGGETLERSWQLLNPGGRMITIAADAEATTDPRVKTAFFIVEPNGGQLASIAELLAAGALRSFVKAELPLDQADQAYAGLAGSTPTPGKIVISVRSEDL